MRHEIYEHVDMLEIKKNFRHENFVILKKHFCRFYGCKTGNFPLLDKT